MRRNFLLLLLILGLFTLAACGNSDPDPTEPAPTSASDSGSTTDDPDPTAAPETTDSDLDEITIAYFLEWPTPNQVAQLEETYDDELGVKVNWVSFDTGVAMSAAMASGDVDIAYSQGLVPFANAVTSGLPIQAVGIAVSYAENDNCVARTDLGITADNAAELEGQQVAVPIGTVAHYKMLKEMQYLGVDTDNLELVDLSPADGAAALQRGDVAMACGWGGALARMKEAGNILMTGAEMEEKIGLIVFDVVSVTDDFAENHGDMVTKFLQVTEDANAAFAADQGKLDVIAQAAGMDEDATMASLATFSFPNAEAQLGDAWMGGTVQTFVKEVADFFVEQGELDEALDDYSSLINTSFLEGVESKETWMATMGGSSMADDMGSDTEYMERPDEITVAYFLEWPTPNQVAQLEKTYDDVMGVDVNWVSFDTGVAMSAAMASGDVDIAYSQGLVPFANAVTAGIPLQAVGIAVSYAENDNCVARTDLGITADNATDLHGEQVAVPIGTVAHYKMLKEMEYLGVDLSQLELVDLSPADGAAALQRGDVAMACGWGGALARMKEAGNILMTGAEMEEEIGLIVFDVVSVTDDFAKNHGDIVTEFLQVTEDANAAFAADQGKLDVIAQAAGMDEDATMSSLSTFSFPSAEAQLSDAWMGGTVQSFVQEVADFFVEQGELDAALDDYAGFINTSFLENVESKDTWMATMGASSMGEEMMDASEADEPEYMDRPDEITVAYFLEWPTPNQVAQLEKTYDDVMGVDVNWVSFDTGVAMSAAMASGDVDIAYSQGLVPFANAVTAGIPLQAVGVAVSYAENDNCVARTDLGITADNATDLHGQQVAVPIGTVAHYKMLKEMEYLGVDLSQLELVDLAPADGAAALIRGDVAMACGWGGALARMKEAGNILMTGAEMEEQIGLIVFDVVSVTDDFAKNHGDIVTEFLQVTEDANAAFAADQGKLDVIAQAAGMDEDATMSSLSTFSFPNAEAQLSDAWMGGTVQNFVQEVADFFVAQGELDEALDDYAGFINTSFLENVESKDTWMATMGGSSMGDDMSGEMAAMPEDMEDRPDELTVAYFLEWPTPNQVAQLEETYDDALGMTVNWVSFDTGVAMSAAMASGDVDIAYSQGLVPFANAVTAGLPLQMVGIAVSYAENDNCVVATDLGITADNATDLHGMQVSVPIGTVAHYKMLKEMEYLGVDVTELEVVDLAPADGAAALQRGDVAMACGWGGALSRMKEVGNILMTGAEMEEKIGLKVFDVVSVTDDFAMKHPSVIRDFMQVTEEANAAYAADPTAKLDVIAQAAGMDEEGSADILATFSFPDRDTQLSDAWMGGTVQNFVQEVAEFFVEQGELEESLDDYGQFINTVFLENVEN